MDVSSMLSTFMGKAHSVSEHEDDAIYRRQLYEMMNSMNSLETRENDLKAFKEYIEKENRI